MNNSEFTKFESLISDAKSLSKREKVTKNLKFEQIEAFLVRGFGLIGGMEYRDFPNILTTKLRCKLIAHESVPNRSKQTLRIQIG